MNFANTVRIVLAINFMILYSQAQRDGNRFLLIISIVYINLFLVNT